MIFNSDGDAGFAVGEAVLMDLVKINIMSSVPGTSML